jgi:hypothetical protein
MTPIAINNITKGSLNTFINPSTTIFYPSFKIQICQVVAIHSKDIQIHNLMQLLLLWR